MPGVRFLNEMWDYSNDYADAACGGWGMVVATEAITLGVTSRQADGERGGEG